MKSVLFVCVHNAGRSQMAEAWLNHFAEREHLDWHAKSAGTIGGCSLNDAAVMAMAEVGIALAGHHPKLLSPEMIERADHVISMGCAINPAACPSNFILTEDWGLADPANQSIESVRIIRDQIRDRVRELIGRGLDRPA